MRFFIAIAIAVLISACASENAIYRGETHNGQAHGHGWKEWPDGSKYDGEWSYGLMQGKGVFTWKNGNRYEGAFLNNEQTGQGAMSYRDGGHYVGGWQGGARSGHGEMIFPNKNRYVGAWANDAPSNGTMEYGNGTAYVGRFSSNGREGDGAALARYYKQDGRWCIDDCTDDSAQYAVVSGTFAPDSASQSLSVKPCGTDRNKCMRSLAPTVAALEKERARKLADIEREKARQIADVEREKARKEAAIIAEKQRVIDDRKRFLATGGPAQLYMDADRLETNKDFVQATEVYRIVVSRFPQSHFAASAMTRLGAMRDKRDQQEAEEKRVAADAAARESERALRREEIAAQRANAEANRVAAQNSQPSMGGKIARSVACVACDQMDGFAKMACKAAACN